MSDQDPSSKTEEASEKKLQESHAKGEFAKTPEMGVVFGLAAALLAFSLGIPEAARHVGEYAIGVLSQIHTVEFDPSQMPPPIREGARRVAMVLAPIMLATSVAALLAGGLQSSFRLTPDALKFKPSKLNPVSGFKRLFSQRVLVMAVVDLLKLLAVGGAVVIAAKALLSDPLFTAPVPAAYLGRFMQESVLLLLARLSVALGAIAAICYAYERFKTHRDMKMTRQEVKDERKQAEGDALVKMAMRRMARRLLQKQMLAAVATADVVITNPTHYAVALKYERGVDAAPVVLAKGENALARRIKALAAHHEVPMVENKPVARLLYATGRVGQAIPADLYQAVATVLAFVYRTHRYYFHRLPARRMEMGREA
jgi:flagellar biosynthesis protein FlhB